MRQSSHKRWNAGLCCIREIQGANPSEIEVDYIAIPGLGGASVKDWPVAQQQWLSSIHSIPTRRYRLLAFEYADALDDEMSVSTILERGEDLLAALLDSRNSAEETKRPIVFLCHSIGGLILKQALCLANQQLYRFYTLLCTVVGILFMGTPHNQSQRTQLEKFTQCVRATTKQRIKLHITQGKLLEDLTKRFNEIQIRIAIASVYETRETKVKNRALLPSLKTIIVDRPSAATNTPNEQLIGLPLDHGSIVQLSPTTGTLDSQIEAFLTGVLETALDTIQQKLNLRQWYLSQKRPSLSLIAVNPLAGPIPSLVLEAVGRDALTTSSPGQPPGNSSDLRSIDGSLGIAGLTTSSFSYELVPLVSSFIPAKRKVQLPCYVMDPHVRNPNFCGREHVLREIEEALLLPSLQDESQGPEDRLRQFVICGLGGIGKTEIAIEYAFAHKNDYDAIFFIVADNTAKLDAAFSQISMALSLEESVQPKNHVVSRELVKGWLSSPSKSLMGEDDIEKPQDYARWLMIFDNVDDTDILYDYWPIGGVGSLLITSRDPLSKSIHSVETKSIDLNPLDSDEGTKLLQSLTRMNGDIGQAEEVCNLLGGLPLAISQMAQIIRYQYLNYSTFLERYNDDVQKRELHQIKIKQRPSYGHTLASVWAFESLNAASRSLLEVMSFMDPDCIQQRLLLATTRDYSPFEYPSKPAAFYDARAKLLHGSNIKINTDAGDISIHRLIQDSLRSQLSNERQEEVLAVAIDLLVAVWPPLDVANKHVTHRWKECQALFPHVLSISKAYAKAFKGDLVSPNIQLATLLNDAGWWQHEIGMSHSANDVDLMFQLALSMCARMPDGGPRTLRFDIHHSLGAIANETNQKLKCLEHTKQEHDLAMERFEENPVYDYRLGAAHGQLGIALLMNGDAHAAIESIKASIDTFKLAEGFTKAMLSVGYTNLGHAYLEAGQLDLASSVLETGIKDREELFGKLDTESFKAGFLHYALGNVRCAQGQLDAGFILHQQALFQYKATIGNNHHRTADACHKVAQHSIRVKAYQSATTLIEQALKIWNADREIYKPEIARTTFLKSELQRVMKTVTATSLLSEAASMRREILKVDGPEVEKLKESDFDCLVTFWSR